MLRPLLKKANADPEVFSNFPLVSDRKFVSKLIEKAVVAQGPVPGLNIVNRGINFIRRLDSVPESTIKTNLGIN